MKAGENHVIVSFGSRESAMRYLSRLREAGIPASTRSTPHKIAAGCGLSVSLPESFLQRADALLEAEKLPNRGWWRIRRVGANQIVSKISI